MATTALQIINRAGRRAKVLEGEEAWASADATNQLQLLNDMMAGFRARGIMYTHVTLALSDNVTIDDKMLRNLVLMFTREVALDYGVPIDPVLALEIGRAEQELQSFYKGWLFRQSAARATAA